MTKFVIDGGFPISGKVRSAGNKNAALPILCASLMARGGVWIRNVPKIGDVATLLSLLENMGMRFARQGDYDLRPVPAGLADKPLNAELCRRVKHIS